MHTGFGTLLKDWRTQRRISQLDLGLAANVSARHISFLETGRSRPSRSMVLQLSESLQVPRVDRNRMLDAAGFAPAYRSLDIDSQAMAPIREAVAWTLDRHIPFPGIALDKYWNLVQANAPANKLLALFGIGVGDSLLDIFGSPEALKGVFENWLEVARFMVIRLRTESAHLGGDEVLDQAAERLAAAAAWDRAEGPMVMPSVVPARLVINGARLSLFSTIAQFGSAEDIALADLKIELMFPADDATRSFLLAAQDS